MVVFTCNHCGDSLQKPRVEKHYMVACRSVKSLTCVDCFKDFKGQEYEVHTKCITEEERYSAKGSIPAGIVKKGEAKQESWTEMIKSIIDKETNLSTPLRNLLNTIASYTNVPRKKQKFLNFIKSSSGGRANLHDVEAIWTIIEKYKNEKVAAVVASTPAKGENGEKAAKEEKNRKRKAEDSAEHPEKKAKAVNGGTPVNGDEPVNGDATVNGGTPVSGDTSVNGDATVNGDTPVNEEMKFSFEAKILEILMKKKSVSLSKLQKKVLNAYIKRSGLEAVAPKHIKKFNKKLKKVAGLKVDEESNLVTLDE